MRLTRQSVRPPTPSVARFYVSLTTAMTIIKDDSPPPAYSAIPSIDSAATDRSPERPSSSQAPSAPLPFPVYGTSFPSELPEHTQHQAYGPTPLPQQLQQGTLLPYYDPRSPYAMEQAVSRARWRFVGAFLWAIGIYAACGFITGGIIIDVRRR